MIRIIRSFLYNRVNLLQVSSHSLLIEFTQHNEQRTNGSALVLFLIHLLRLMVLGDALSTSPHLRRDSLPQSLKRRVLSIVSEEIVERLDKRSHHVATPAPDMSLLRQRDQHGECICKPVENISLGSELNSILTKEVRGREREIEKEGKPLFFALVKTAYCRGIRIVVLLFVFLDSPPPGQELNTWGDFTRHFSPPRQGRRSQEFPATGIEVSDVTEEEEIEFLTNLKTLIIIFSPLKSERRRRMKRPRLFDDEPLLNGLFMQALIIFLPLKSEYVDTTSFYR